MDFYFEEQADPLLALLTDDPTKQGFSSQIFGAVRSSSDTSLPYYKIGSPMRMQRTVGGVATIGTFSLPEPDVNGVCNNNYAVHFLENKETSCTQIRTLKKHCTSSLNPTSISSMLEVLAGQRS